MGPGQLKILGGTVSALVCTGSALLVADDPKPASAPLKPPVSSHPEVAGDGLVIPPTCATTPPGSRPRRTRPTVPLTAGEQAAVQKWDATRDPAQRRAVLAALPADQRQQVTAYLQNRAAGGNGGCSAGSSPSSSSGTVVPSIVDTPGSVTALSNSYVS